MCQNRYIHCQLNVKLYIQETRSKMLLIMMTMTMMTMIRTMMTMMMITMMMTYDNDDDDDDYDDEEDDEDDTYFYEDLSKSTIPISFDFKKLFNFSKWISFYKKV